MANEKKTYKVYVLIDHYMGMAVVVEVTVGGSN